MSTGIGTVRVVLCLVLWLTTGCGAVLGSGEPTPVRPGARCRVGASQTSVLVTEWAAGEKANLEAGLGNGAVAVEFSGCELRLIPECRLSGSYAWHRTTPATDVVEIHDEAELYAKLPIGAAKLSGELQRSGSLAVETTVAGQMRLDGMTAEAVTAAPACARATHIVGGLSLGAFVLRAGLHARGQAGVSVGETGIGGAQDRRERVVRTAGVPGSCADATDEAAARDCASPIQVFLEPIPGRVGAAAPPGTIEVDIVSGEPSTRWDVFVDDKATCTTPCSQYVEPARPVEVRTRIGMSTLTIKDLPDDRGPLQVTAHPTRFGQLATGIVFTAFGGMALITGVTLTAVGCGDGGSTCTPGLITGGIALPVTAGAILVLLDSLPELEVRPIFESNNLRLSATGLSGSF